MVTVLHVPYTYYPDPVGGTEIYVEQLCAALCARGIANVIVAPGEARRTYAYDGVPVERLEVADSVADVQELYGYSDARAAQEFDALLAAHQPQLVHLHAFTRIVSVRFVQVAHARGIPVVFTYHTPTVSCLRSGLMLWGREVCDGVLDAGRCTSCRLHSLGMPESLAQLLARAPRGMRAWGAGHQGGAWTALRMRDLVARQHTAIRNLFDEVDRIIALCEWTREVLERNQVPPEKIAFVPHGFSAAGQQAVRVDHSQAVSDPLRLVTLGRLEPVKGIDLLVHALAELPQLPLTLDIYGIRQSDSETPFAANLRAQVARDPRVRLLAPVPHSQVVSLLKQYDALAAPSLWLETGPLVVLEAFAAGIPVIGSNLGGIAEKVEDGVNGLLVPISSHGAWRDALARLGRDRELVRRLRAKITPPRSMEQVAEEMSAVYAEVLAPVPA